MRFKEWLKLHEVGTSTSCIAGFSRIVLPLVTRKYPNDQEEKKDKKKKSKTDSQ